MSDEPNRHYFLILSLLYPCFAPDLCEVSLCLLVISVRVEACTLPSRMSRFIDFRGSKSFEDNSVHLSSQSQTERGCPENLRICAAQHAHGTRNQRGSCRGRGSDLAGQTGLDVPHLPDRGSFSCGTRSSPDLEPTPGTPGRSSRCSSAGAWPQPCGGPQACPSGWRAGHCPEQSH